MVIIKTLCKSWFRQFSAKLKGRFEKVYTMGVANPCRLVGKPLPLCIEQEKSWFLSVLLQR
jgi:hypothetical protein